MAGHIAALDTSVITGIIYFILCFIPVVAYAIPLFIGLGMLSGRIGNTSTSAKQIGPKTRAALGVVMLIIGWVIATTVEYGILVSVGWLVG